MVLAYDLVVNNNQVIGLMELSNAELLREVVRRYVRSQRMSAACLDGRSTVQCHVLGELLREERLTQQMLTQSLGLDKGWISRAVDGLVATGDVERSSNPEDRRSTWLRLSAAGRTRAARLNQQLNQHSLRLLTLVGAEQDASMRRALSALLAALDSDARAHPTQTSHNLDKDTGRCNRASFRKTQVA